MATTLTRYLKLRLSDDLTADARYNLNRLDSLAATFVVDTNSNLNLKSRRDITLEPESADIGGTGLNGVINLSTPDHPIELNAYVSDFTIEGDVEIDGDLLLDNPLKLLDQAAGGNKSLLLQYKSDLTGLVDTSANRILSIDLEGSDRSIILGGNLTTSGGALTFNTLSGSAVTVPVSGTLATLAGSETLTNKSIDADNNTITNIRNDSIHSAAAIEYSKLNLVGMIQDIDIAASADIEYTKLNLANQIVNNDISTSAAIAYSKLNLLGNIVDADINSSAAIQYSKLNLNNKIENSDIKTAAGIEYSKLDLTGSITNNDIAALAEIEYSKLYLTGTITNSDISDTAAINAAKIGDGSVSNTEFSYLNGATSNIQAQIDAIDNSLTAGAEVSATWSSADGGTKVVTHNLNTRQIQVQILDNSNNYDTIEVDSIDRGLNSITFTASSAPASSWTILLKEIL